MCIASYEQGQRLHKSGDLLGAKAELLTCMFPTCPEALRRDCSVWLQQVEAATPTMVVEARDPAGYDVAIDVTVDGAPVRQASGTPIAVNPGPHVVEVRAGAAPTTSYRLTARAGEKGRRLHVVFPPPVPREVWILGGLGVVEAGVATYFVWRGHDELDDCASACSPGDKESVRVANTAAGVSAGLAALSLGAAGWLYWTRPRAQWSEPSLVSGTPRVQVQVGADAAVLQVSGLF